MQCQGKDVKSNIHTCAARAFSRSDLHVFHASGTWAGCSTSGPMNPTSTVMHVMSIAITC